MHFDAGAIQRHGLQLDLRALQLFERTLQHTGLRPAAHARVNGVPVAEAFGQPAPFTAMLSDVQDRVENLMVGQANVASLARQAIGNLFELLLGDLHAPTVAARSIMCN